jgi:hypothetical protein
MILYRYLPILLFVIVSALGLLGYSTVQAQSCQTNVTYDYPKQVNPAEQIRITSVVTGSCFFPAGFPLPDSYSIRIDVTDQGTGRIISSNSANTGYSTSAYGTPYFAATVNNTVVAPSTATTWLLGFSVYISGNGKPLYATSGSATIKVGTPVTTVISATTVIFSTVQHSVTTTQTSTITQSYLSQQNLMDLIFALLAGIAIVWFLFRRRVRREDRTRVY